MLVWNFVMLVKAIIVCAIAGHRWPHQPYGLVGYDRCERCGKRWGDVRR